MPKTCQLYSSEFRRQMVELVRAGRDPEDPARAFDLTAPSIRAWVARADRAEGRREELAFRAGLALAHGLRNGGGGGQDGVVITQAPNHSTKPG